ncbi:E3 ubiquitin-protein ligase RNF31 [Microtus ochrogaster]|uniref:E3 ubiquitin-protein ligase RNF31 n=1 Tax=Microtus ochrogaster TaxID=79684 RepID=A0A8J6GE35_MICOH|nr:E3 ubiquitin-protein ligase RNF31 [Microtus ochrogaster]
MPGEEERAFLAAREELASALRRDSAQVFPLEQLKPFLATSLPPAARYLQLDAGRLVRCNAHGETRNYLNTLSTALNILEKYGRNLLSPQRPRYWRSVKFNNPVFRSTVDAVQGGRDVLRLYGYTEERPDGLSFPEGQEEPDEYQVAIVTLEVLLLRTELSLLLQNKHPRQNALDELLRDNVEDDMLQLSEFHPLLREIVPGPLPSAPDTVWVCAMCNRTRNSIVVQHALRPYARSLEKDLPKPGSPEHLSTSLPGSCGDPEKHRQDKMRKESLQLVSMIQEGEAAGASPEEIFSALQYSGTEVPLQWLRSELSYVLEMVAELAGQQDPGLGAFSCQEARKAWLDRHGNLDEAVEECVRARRRKVKELQSLGFGPKEGSLQALFQHGGDVARALTELQRQRLEPFHQRLWDRGPEPTPCWDGLDRQMQALISCECTICPDCFRQHFTIALKEKHITDMVCPACGRPDLTDDNQLLSYFSTLDIQLRDSLDPDAYALFHKKLTEGVLMRDPKFLWCAQCSFGFIYEREQLEATCPQCHQTFCVRCKRQWEEQHRGRSCEEFQNWKRTNDPEYQAQGLAMYLQENGIDCPKCKFSYALARGGCMHFHCTQCRHQFCSGCYNAFYAKNDNNVMFNTEPPAGTRAVPGGGCRVMEQKEVPSGFRDEACGKETPPGYAGLCQAHYKEYLVSLINAHSLDPATLYDVEELETATVRYLHVHPQAVEGEDRPAYQARLLQLSAPPTPPVQGAEMGVKGMASGKPRCTRKLRNWIIEQLESGQFLGVCWDDTAKTMFRIPWKHAGKQDFREDQDAAIFKAWALFKEKHKDGDIGHPAVWKTRLRCALNKSSEFEEVPERGRMDVAEPYKVYRILPPGTLPDASTTEAPVQEDPVFVEHLLPPNSDYSLLLTFIYSGRVVHEVKVHSLDCRLVAKPSALESNILPVLFPKPDPPEPIQSLLNQLERGILVASNSRGLFVQCLCPIPISWDAPEAPSGSGPHLLPSNKCVELFSTSCFCREQIVTAACARHPCTCVVHIVCSCVLSSSSISLARVMVDEVQLE